MIKSEKKPKKLRAIEKQLEDMRKKGFVEIVGDKESGEPIYMSYSKIQTHRGLV